ncbi:MAG: SsrA-binding protein [Parcubacteria group bacterium Gr01-1014_72]|nr:MAG: SsrA-binding protein [Parcubacteria group bacterium Gr01-1014_72]
MEMVPETSLFFKSGAEGYDSGMEGGITNRKARFNYDILETFTAGIALFGHEVKAIRIGRGSIVGAHVIVRGGEAYIVGADIPPYQSGNTPKEYDPKRTRRLLLTKKEIALLAAAEAKKGLTVVPLQVYNKGKRIKVEVAIARGRKEYDKREAIKKRETLREVRREAKER